MSPSGPDLLGRLAARLLDGSHLRPEDLRDDAVPARIGRYEVVRPLGRGGGGRVFLAEDPALGRVVAVKVLGRVDAQSEARFRREMQLLARLEHPGIVRVHDAGVDEEGRPFFVMEHVDAPELGDRRLPLPEAARVLEAVARACHAAHQAGVIHRDLKPGNVLVGPRPVVLDFGVACLMGDGDASRAGTPEYMAPEQVTGAPVGPWTDVYALGVLLYEQLAGRTPFEDVDAARVLERVRREEPRPPRALRPDAPPALERLCLRALQKRPEERPGSALEVAEALARWRDGPRRRRQARRAALALGGLLLAGGLGLALWPAPPPAAPAPQPAAAPPPEPAAPPRDPGPATPRQDRGPDGFGEGFGPLDDPPRRRGPPDRWDQGPPDRRDQGPPGGPRPGGPRPGGPRPEGPPFPPPHPDLGPPPPGGERGPPFPPPRPPGPRGPRRPPGEPPFPPPPPGDDRPPPPPPPGEPPEEGAPW